MANAEHEDAVEEAEEKETVQPRIEVGGEIKTFEEVTPKKALKVLRETIADYEDYQSVPSRRKTDEAFRKYVKETLTQANDHIKEIHAALIEAQQMSTWAIADQVINDLGAFIKDVDKGDYGFTTFFENPRLLEMDISQLYIIDYDFIKSIRVLNERISAFMEIVQQHYFEDTDLWFETLNRILGRLISLNDDRIKLIGSYERISY